MYTVRLQLEEGVKFNIKNLTANSAINADHLIEVYTESGSITVDGNHVKVLKSGYYSIVYMPCYNGFMIEEIETPADVYMLFGGEFIPLLKDTGGIVTYEGLVADVYSSVVFTDPIYNYLPITLDSETNASIAHIVQSGGMDMVFFDKAGTYNLAYNAETGVLSIISVGGDGGGDAEFDPSSYLYYLSVSGGSGGNQTLTMQVDRGNAKEVCYKGAVLTANCFISVIEMAKDASNYTTYGAIADTDPQVAQSYGTAAMIKIAGTYDVYFDTQAKTVKLVRTGDLPEQAATVPKDIYIRYDNILTLIENPDNPDELCYLGLEIGSFQSFTIRDTNRNDINDITLAEGTAGVSTNGTSIAFQMDGPFNIYINKTTHEVRISKVS